MFFKKESHILTIALVDNDVDVRKKWGQILTSRGHKVKTYIGAKDFLSKYKPGKFDLVLIDWLMPYNGKKLIDHFTEHNPKQPFLIFSVRKDKSFATIDVYVDKNLERGIDEKVRTVEEKYHKIKESPTRRLLQLKLLDVQFVA